MRLPWLELVGYWKSTKIFVKVAESTFSGRRENLPKPTVRTALPSRRPLMGDTWITSLEHMLDERGGIAAPKGPGRKLAEHIVAIVAMASRPEVDPPPEYRVRCRRRPGRKPCPGMINVNLDPETENIVCWCPVCHDNGKISNWKGSMWDLRDAGEIH